MARKKVLGSRQLQNLHSKTLVGIINRFVDDWLTRQVSEADNVVGRLFEELIGRFESTIHQQLPHDVKDLDTILELAYDSLGEAIVKKLLEIRRKNTIRS